MSTFSSRFGVIALILVIIVTPIYIRPQDDRIKTDPTVVTDLAIGSSHVQSINFAAMGVTGYNMGRNSADLMDAAISMQRHIDKFANLQRVWMPVSPVILERYRLESLTIHADLILPTDVARPLFFLERNLRANIFNWAQLRLDFKRWVDASFGTGLSEKLPDLVISHEGRRNSLRVTTTLKRIASAEFAVKGQLKNAIDDTQTGAGLLFFIADLAKQRGVDIIFFTPPLSREYYDHPSLRPYVATLNSHMTQVEQSGANVYFFDNHAFFPADDTKHFVDANHTNFQGATEFSPHLFRQYLQARSKNHTD